MPNQVGGFNPREMFPQRQQGAFAKAKDTGFYVNLDTINAIAGLIGHLTGTEDILGKGDLIPTESVRKNALEKEQGQNALAGAFLGAGGFPNTEAGSQALEGRMGLPITPSSGGMPPTADTPQELPAPPTASQGRVPFTESPLSGYAPSPTPAAPPHMSPPMGGGGPAPETGMDPIVALLASRLAGGVGGSAGAPPARSVGGLTMQGRGSGGRGSDSLNTLLTQFGEDRRAGAQRSSSEGIASAHEAGENTRNTNRIQADRDIAVMNAANTATKNLIDVQKNGNEQENYHAQRHVDATKQLAGLNKQINDLTSAPYDLHDDDPQVLRLVGQYNQIAHENRLGALAPLKSETPGWFGTSFGAGSKIAYIPESMMGDQEMGAQPAKAAPQAQAPAVQATPVVKPTPASKSAALPKGGSVTSLLTQGTGGKASSMKRGDPEFDQIANEMDVAEKGGRTPTEITRALLRGPAGGRALEILTARLGSKEAAKKLIAEAGGQ